MSTSSSACHPHCVKYYLVDLPASHKRSLRTTRRAPVAVLPARAYFINVAGDFEGIKMYVESGGNISRRDFFNNTALHRSASMGFNNITRYLLQAGAEVDAVANDGWTPLHLACRWGRVGAIKTLVEAGADVDRVTKDGRVPGELLKVEMRERDRVEIMKLLGYTPSRTFSKHEINDE